MFTRHFMSFLKMASIVACASPFLANAQTRSPVYAPTPFTFTKVFENENVLLETDTASYTALLDEDNDKSISGVFRLTRKTAGPTENAVFVSVVLTICGYKSILTLYTKNFNMSGKAVGFTPTDSPSEVKPNTLNAVVQKSMCDSPTQPTPINRNTRAPARNVEFWTKL